MSERRCSQTHEAVVMSNPDNPVPPEILRDITPVGVGYTDFEGISHYGLIEVHIHCTRDVRDFFSLAEMSGFPIHNITRSSDPDFQWDDEKLMTANVTSGFNYRAVEDTDRLSLHSYGMAFDVNPIQNPYIRFDSSGKKLVLPEGAVYDTNEPGTLFATHPLVILMKLRGWTWGGDWLPEDGRVDYQHFEKLL